jgi:hypothetical protein
VTLPSLGRLVENRSCPPQATGISGQKFANRMPAVMGETPRLASDARPSIGLAWYPCKSPTFRLPDVRTKRRASPRGGLAGHP